MFDEVIDSIESAAADHIKEEQGDYYQDGLLYCGKCHTQKQVRVTIFGIERKPYCLCKCAVEQLEKEQAEDRKRERRQRIERNRKNAFADPKLIDCRFEKGVNTNETGLKASQNYVDNFPEFLKAGRGLLFFGAPGTGKTFLAACIANALIDRGYTVLVTSFSRMVHEMQGSLGKQEEYLHGLSLYQLLVIDDYAAERDTDYMNEQVYNILDRRLRTGLPVVLTTNLTAAQLKEPKEVSRQRITSRIYEMCFPIEITGTDRRREKLKQDYERLKGMLGV